MSAPSPSRLWRRKPTKGLGGKEPNMLIIGCDYHPGFQQIALVDTETGELEERRLAHREEAEQFYQELKQRNVAVRVGMESSGHSRWFERLLRQLEFELWIGDAAEIRTKRVRKQKTDRQDAQLLLRLMMEDRFPRIWVPDAANRDMRQLLWHRHRLVQMRTRVMNQLHVVAVNCHEIPISLIDWRLALGLFPPQRAPQPLENARERDHTHHPENPKKPDERCSC